MSRQRWTLFGLLLIAVVGVGGPALVRARSESTSPREETRASAITAAPTPLPSLPRSLDPVQNIRFTIYDAGILPREIKVKQGLVSIVIEDRTRKSEGLGVELEVGNGRLRVGQVKLFQDFWRGRDQVRLVPGTYVVFDTSKPTNQARLIAVP
jgi:hypothetical protein